MSSVTAFSGFLVLALAWTHPLALHLTTAFPGGEGDTDVVTFIWNLWWMRHALVELEASPFVTEHVFAPFEVDLRLHTFAPLHGLFSLALQPWLGPVGAFNVLLLGTMTMNGYATYLLAHRWLERFDVAWLAGALVSTNPALTFFVVTGRPSFASVWPIALGTLFVERLHENRRTGDAIGLGLSALAALFLDLQVLLFFGLWLGVHVLWTRRFTPKLLFSAAMAAVPFALIFLPALSSAPERGFGTPSLEDSLTYSLQAENFAHPPTLRFLLGWATPLLALVAASVFPRERRVRVFLVLGGLFLLLSLGARLQPTELPLPFALLRELPGMAQFRTPYRFTIPAALALAMAGASAVHHLRGRFHPKLVWAVAAFSVADGFLAEPQRHPFRIQRYPEAPLYERIAAEPGDFVVLQVPLGVRSGLDAFGRGETLQYYQMIHGKRGVNGMVARVPARYFDYYRSSPALKLLAGEDVEDDAELPSDLEAKLEELEVGYLVLHERLVSEERAIRIGALLERRPGATLVHDSAALRAWKIERAD